MCPSLGPLIIDNLQVKQGAFLLNVPSLRLEPGEKVLLAGPNGAGKTTLMESVLGLRAHTGSACLAGSLDAAIKSVSGYVPTDLSFFPGAFARDVAALVASLYRDWNASRFKELADAWKVPMERRLKSFSMGEKRRFYLALSLSHNTRLLVLDEPLATLDPQMVYDLLALLDEVVRREQLILWVSSNILDPFWQTADRIDFLRDGSLVRSLQKTEWSGRTAEDVWKDVMA